MEQHHGVFLCGNGMEKRYGGHFVAELWGSALGQRYEAALWHDTME